jgi:AcrR family transcriptional regulator
MDQDQAAPDGWREKKRRETRERISAKALALFAANGYEATTLDAIAEAAGISRRTFFYYFASKEEILAAWQEGLPNALRATILAEPADQSPFEVVRNAKLKLVANYNAAQAVVIDRIIRSSEQLRAANQTKYLELEEAAYEALRELWPETERRYALRVVAMATVGALRLAIDVWAEEDGRRPLSDYLQQAFAALRSELSD